MGQKEQQYIKKTGRLAYIVYIERVTKSGVTNKLKMIDQRPYPHHANWHHHHYRHHHHHHHRRRRRHRRHHQGVTRRSSNQPSTFLFFLFFFLSAKDSMIYSFIDTGDSKRIFCVHIRSTLLG